MRGFWLLARDFYTRYFGIIVDSDVSILPTGYMPQSAPLATVYNPRTKYFKNLGMSDYSRAKELLVTRMTERLEEILMKEAAAAAANARHE